MKNTISSLLIIGALALLTFGCITYDLKPKDEAWNPYEIGEKFTFVSNLGNKRTFTVSKIEKSTSRVNVYAGNLSRLKESLVVFAREENTAAEEVPILAIFKNSDNESFVNFILNLNDILEINHVEAISALDAKLGSLTGFAGNDFLEISPVQNVSPDVETPYINRFIFSKSTGFIQFTLTTNEIWTLKRN